MALRNQLHSTANGYKHLNFVLMCKGKTLLEAVNKLFAFSSADPKQNINAEWAQKFKFLYTSCIVKWFHETELRGLYLYFSTKSLDLWMCSIFFFCSKSNDLDLAIVLSLANKCVKCLLKFSCEVWICSRVINNYSYIYLPTCWVDLS